MTTAGILDAPMGVGYNQPHSLQPSSLQTVEHRARTDPDAPIASALTDGPSVPDALIGPGRPYWETGRFAKADSAESGKSLRRSIGQKRDMRKNLSPYRSLIRSES